MAKTGHPLHMKVGLVGLAALAMAGTAAADDPPQLRVDGGLALRMPAALPAGLSRGVQAGATLGDRLAYGAHVAWATDTEYTTRFSVRHTDLVLHAVGAYRHAAGRGAIALRLGLGGTLVHETRTRDQGERAGLTGDDLQTTAWRMLPSAELELAVSLRVVGDWGVAIGGGPTLNLRDRSAHGGWAATLGVAWLP